MYTVELTRSALRELPKLPRDVQTQLALVVEALASEPRPSGVKKLTDQQRLYRVRSGDYRVVYEVRDAVLVVVVVALGDRKEIYRRYR